MVQQQHIMNFDMTRRVLHQDRRQRRHHVSREARHVLGQGAARDTTVILTGAFVIRTIFHNAIRMT